MVSVANLYDLAVDFAKRDLIQLLDVDANYLPSLQSHTENTAMLEISTS